MPVVKGRWIADMKIDRVADNEEPAEERAHDFRPVDRGFTPEMAHAESELSLIHISEPTRPRLISYAVFCLKKKKRKKKRKKKKTFFFFFFNDTATTEIYTLSVVGSVRCV